MKKFKYIVIDAEYPAHLMVQHYFRPHPNYTCIATFFNPKNALIFLQEHEIDLIFLDIEMPEMDGFQFLEALKKDIFVVILTTYPEKHSLCAHYHIDKNLVFFSGKVQFLDYFPQIIARFERMYAEKEIINRINKLFKNEIYTFPEMMNNPPIPLVDILMIIVFGHNIVLKKKDGEEIVYRMTLRELMKFLPITFLQIKRNVIINTIHVTAFTNSTVCIEEHHFLISARKQKEVIQTLKAQLYSLYKIMN